MLIKSKQLFILIGDDRTGKTTLQKTLIEKLNGSKYSTLPTNLLFDIYHPEIKRKYQTISFANRSYQEKIGTYGTVNEYFENHFKEADICIVSSHLVITDIIEMIRNAKQRFYNVTGIFFENSIKQSKQANEQISLLEWDERLFIENALTDDNARIHYQLNAIAESFVTFLSNRIGIS
jgi:GTPase SAR1 family protein